MISRETDYAIRMLRYLSDRQLHSNVKMCDDEHIPVQFGYKILDKLQDARIVESVRGRYGGCRLIASLEDVTLFQLIEIVGNRFCFNQCLEPGKNCEWQETHPENCNVHKKLQVMQTEMEQTMNNITLQELIWGD